VRVLKALFIQLCVLAASYSQSSAGTPAAQANTGKAKNAPVVVKKAEGDVRYRAAGTLNWVKLGTRTELFVGDLLFIRDSSSARIEYTAVGAAVELPEQTLFRIGEKPPTYTKLRRKFGVEDLSAKGQSATISGQGTDPFERVQVRPLDESDGGKNLVKNGQVQILREKQKIVVDVPQNKNLFIAKTFPTKVAARVSPEFLGQKQWAFLWAESDKVNPVWSGHSLGEFTSILVPAAGKYELQVMSDDEMFLSDTILLEFRSADTSTNKDDTTTEKNQLSEILQNLRDKRESDFNIVVE
jgi:hypothetical protein